MWLLKFSLVFLMLRIVFHMYSVMFAKMSLLFCCSSSFSADVISLCKLGFRHVGGAHARCETMPLLSAHDQSLQIIHLFNGYFPRKRPKSQDEIPVLSSYGKNAECYVRERYLKNISVVGVYRSSGHSEREVQLRMFAFYRSLELALLFSFYTNKQFKALKCPSQLSSGKITLKQQISIQDLAKGHLVSFTSAIMNS